MAKIHEIGDAQYIHELDSGLVCGGGGFVISEADCWRPGSYSTKAAAEYAFKFEDDDLQRLQDKKSPGFITLFDLFDLESLLYRTRTEDAGDGSAAE